VINVLFFLFIKARVARCYQRQQQHQKNDNKVSRTPNTHNTNTLKKRRARTRNPLFESKFTNVMFNRRRAVQICQKNAPNKVGDSQKIYQKNTTWKCLSGTRTSKYRFYFFSFLNRSCLQTG